MRRLVVGLFIFLSGLFVGGALIYTFPIPFPDQGHRLFGVRDEKAHFVLLNILEYNGGLKKSWAFDAGQTHQVVMNDNMTVIAWFDPEVGDLPKNAISVAVNDPMFSAKVAVKVLRGSGYSAEIHQPMKDLPDNTLVLVKTNALINSALVFRKPFWKMPKPKLRK